MAGTNGVDILDACYVSKFSLIVDAQVVDSKHEVHAPHDEKLLRIGKLLSFAKFFNCLKGGGRGGYGNEKKIITEKTQLLKKVVG